MRAVISVLVVLAACSTPQAVQDTSDIEKRLTAIEERLDAMEPVESDLEQVASDLGELQGRVSTLEAESLVPGPPGPRGVPGPPGPAGPPGPPGTVSSVPEIEDMRRCLDRFLREYRSHSHRVTDTGPSHSVSTPSSSSGFFFGC